jgi:hypothetical protein
MQNFKEINVNLTSLNRLSNTWQQTIWQINRYLVLTAHGRWQMFPRINILYHVKVWQCYRVFGFSFCMSAPVRQVEWLTECSLCPWTNPSSIHTRLTMHNWDKNTITWSPVSLHPSQCHLKNIVQLQQMK